MDKMKKKNLQISILLNGKEKVINPLKLDKQAGDRFHSLEKVATNKANKDGDDFPWQLTESEPKQPSPKVVDLGELRRDKQKLTAPFWDDGKSGESPKLPHKKRKKQRKLELNFRALPLGLIGVILAAIIVGTSFGLMMLNIFTGDKGEAINVPSVAQELSATVGSVAAAEQKIPTLAVEVVQGGAFSLLAKGQETAQAIKDNGFSATLTNTTDPVYLFIGVGLDREQATVIAEQHQANGQAVYMKPYAATASGTEATENQTLFMQAGVKLYQQLTLLSVNALADGGSLLTAETMAELTAIHQEFQAIKDSFKENEQQQTLALAFQDTLANAYQQLQSFASTKEPASFWQVQQFLLNGLIAYEELIKTL